MDKDVIDEMITYLETHIKNTIEIKNKLAERLTENEKVLKEQSEQRI